MVIKKEWLHHLVNFGFSASGARSMLTDLRLSKSGLGDDEFGRWLAGLKPREIARDLTVHYLSRV